MKIRQGFVSNSSSSSFVCNWYDSDYKVIPFNNIEVINKLDIIYTLIKDLHLSDNSFYEIFGEIRPATKKDIANLNKNWDAKLKYNKNMYLINSADDNSIPYGVFELIEQVFNAKRIHLG